MRIAVAFALVASLLGSSAAGAHDFWLEPASFHPDVGATLPVRLWIGPPADAAPFPRDPTHFAIFRMLGPGPDGALEGFPLPGRAGRVPAGIGVVPRAGVYAIGYESRPIEIDLDAGTFEAYLAEKGLHGPLRQRLVRGESGRGTRERYTRCTKALLRAGDPETGGHALRLGLALEIVPAADPWRGPRDRGPLSLPVDVWYHGARLADVQVDAVRIDRPAREAKPARTDRDGRAILELPTAGRWLITTVQMRRAGTPVAVEWESTWASLSLELPP